MFNDGLRYQESRMASDVELTSDLDSFYIGEEPHILRGGPVLFRDINQLYVDSSDSHSLILGDTGSMKTLRFVLPLIYTCAKAG